MKISAKGRKHQDCEICNLHPLFDLDEKVFIHGQRYTKEYLLKSILTVDGESN